MYRTCIICQKAGNLITSKDISKKKIIECTKIRMSIGQGKDASVLHIFTNFNNIKERDNLQWHKNCYKTYTSSKNIASYKLKYLKINSDHFQAGTSQKRSLRKISFDVQKCVFCQKRSNNQKLCQVMSRNMEDKIKTISRKNSLYYSRIGENDLIASEIKYHASCVSTELRNTTEKSSTTGERKLEMKNEALQKLFTELEKGFEKGKGYSTISVRKRYLEYGGNLELSDRSLVKKIKEHFGDAIELVKSVRRNEPSMFLKKFSQEQVVETILQHSETETSNFFCGVSELQIFTKICQSIKAEIHQIPAHADFINLNINDYKKDIPNNLYFIISLLVSNELDSNIKETQILNICQDIIFACSNGKKYTPKHIGLGLIVHQETRSKKLVESIHACGHSISYIDTLRVRNSIAQEEIKLYLENDQIIIPRQLVPNRFVQFAADNIDILEETLDKAPTFHGTQMAVFQRGPINEIVPGNFEFLPYKIKLTIPNDFHSLEKISFNKTTKKVQFEENQPIIIEKGQNLSYNIKYQNIAWSMCRMTDSENEDMILPQWSGFHKLIFTNHSHTTTYGYLPLLPHVSSEYDTVWTVIKKCNQIADKLNNMHTVITFDQAVYYKAKELQWHKPEETKNVIIRLGGFHIIMNFLKIIGQYMANSGLADVWLESGLYGQATIDGILAGKKYNKAIRAHKLTYESLMRILISLYNNWLVECKSFSVHTLNLIHLCSAEIRDHIKRKEDALPSFYKISNLTEELFEEFPQFIETQTATFKYWYTYLELVEILLEFIFAERNGNWELHLNSFRKMLPWFFAFDHTNYARWGTIYLLDMYKLLETVPEVFEEFMNDNFVVKRLNGNFNQLSVDQALEHINKNSKDAGGIVGLTKNSTKLDEWYLSYNVVGMMLDEFRSSLNIVNNSASQNIECGVKRMIVDEQSVQRFKSEFSRFNVFFLKTKIDFLSFQLMKLPLRLFKVLCLPRKKLEKKL